MADPKGVALSAVESGAVELVSVIVPALNEEASIGALLDSVVAQTYDNIEVLVADGGSTDATRDIIAERSAVDPRIRLVDNPERQIPFALNHAVAAANGRWMVRIDAHAEVPPDYVERIVDHFREHDWGGVGGRKDAVGVTPVGKAIAAAMGSPFMQGNSIYHYGTEVTTTDHIPFGAYPLDMVRELGGWAVDASANQDAEFDHRVRKSGRELLFDPAIVIKWRSRQRLKALWGQAFRYGTGRFLTIRRHPDSSRMRHMIPPVFVAVSAFAIVLGLFKPKWGAALLAPYAAVVVAGTVDTLRRGVPAGSRRFLPLVFIIQHYGWGSGFLFAAWKWMVRRENATQAFTMSPS